MPEEKLVSLGRITKPHGIRGELGVECYAESPFVFEDVPGLTLRRPGSRPRTYQPLSCRVHHDRVLLRLKGVEDRDAAEALRDMEILARQEDLPRADEHELFLFELEGLEVRLPDGSVLGRIDLVDTGTGQEIWYILTPDGREILFPAADDFVLTLDPDQGFAVIDPPPGLLDIYLSPVADENPDDAADFSDVGSDSDVPSSDPVSPRPRRRQRRGRQA